MQDVYLDAIKMVQQLSVHLRLNGLNHVSTPNRARLCVCVIVSLFVCVRSWLALAALHEAVLVGSLAQRLRFSCRRKDRMVHVGRVSAVLHLLYLLHLLLVCCTVHTACVSHVACCNRRVAACIGNTSPSVCLLCTLHRVCCLLVRSPSRLVRLYVARCLHGSFACNLT